ncbi:hypothetical protein MJM99_30365, partial [Salmonella enterica subsp. enterica serovar Kentucky]|nr:hypothetical protein [Salmonella enterica subsp. enterica serovar Kentucky]
MLTLDTLNTMLAVSEEGMVEEMILALLASPQHAVLRGISLILHLNNQCQNLADRIKRNLDIQGSCSIRPDFLNH